MHENQLLSSQGLHGGRARVCAHHERRALRKQVSGQHLCVAVSKPAQGTRPICFSLEIFDFAGILISALGKKRRHKNWSQGFTN